MAADRFSNPLDERLEALADEPGDPGRRTASNRETPRRRRSDRLGAPAMGEGSLADVAAEFRSLREAFLSLPPLDEVDDRLVEIEARLDGLTAGMDQVLDRLTEMQAMLSTSDRRADVGHVLDRLTTLEGSLSALDRPTPGVDPVLDRLAAIDASLSALDRPTPGVVLERLAALEAMVGALDRPADAPDVEDVEDVALPAKKRSARAAPARKAQGAEAPARKAPNAKGRTGRDERG